MIANKLKILCYGASVTAQKDESGYVQQLRELLPNEHYSIKKIGRGASHFEYAGFGYAREILDYEPDILIVDWLTPSMKKFNQRKVDLFNEYFISKGIVPIWVNFPRKDDLENQRECYLQVKKSCEKYDLTLLDVTKYVKEDPEKYLRDIVHTSKEGAVLYAAYLAEIIQNQHYSLGNITSNCTFDFPKCKEVNSILNNNKSYSQDIHGGVNSLEVLIECYIGPNVPFIKVTAYGSNDSEEVSEKIINPADPWCYYSRKMVLPSIKFQMECEIIKLTIEVANGDPFEDINLLKDINEEITIEKNFNILNIVTYSLE